jgi:hypothetical protein
MKECATDLSSFSKSQLREMYKVNAHELMCMRVSEYNVATYGKDLEVVKLRKRLEGLIKNDVIGYSAKFQANLIASSVCFTINKQGCIASV